MLSIRFTIIVFSLFLVRFINADYWLTRKEFIEQEESKIIGYDEVLTDKELVVNEELLRIKRAEYDAGFKNPGSFLPSMHFFRAREGIHQSEVFKFIRSMPKGAALHGHTKAMASEDYMFNLTYSDDLYGCTVNDHLKLKFFRVPDSSCDWELLADIRKNNASFDKYVRSQLTLWTDEPEQKYPDINQIWEVFENIFSTIGGLLNYRPAFEQYLYDVIKEHYDDKVNFIEIRDSLSSLYDLDDNWTNKLETAEIMLGVFRRFKADYPDFDGVRVIYSPFRRVDNCTFANYVATAKQLRAAYPELIVGFDIVGQEDLGEPLTSFVESILEMENELDFYFHSGETNWYGASTDMNLIDAVLLSTKRIGHGYALTKHPEVLKYIKEKGIAIEVSPISNQVLMLVEDLRNHPAAMFLSDGYPVVITNDDPSFWGAKGLSYDWYMAYMGMTSRDADIRVLKKLAMNSFEYSSLRDTEEFIAAMNWVNQWHKFIDEKYNEIMKPRNVY